MMNAFGIQVGFNQWVMFLTIILISCSTTFGTSQTNDSLRLNLFPNYTSEYPQNYHQIIPKSMVTTKWENKRSIMLPSLNPMDQSYPLFCRLEDKINAGNKIQCLFRLGSLSYVNYLEQKGDHQRLMLEQIR